MVELGLTQSGLFRVGKGALEELEPIAIIVCSEGYFCGAILVEGTDFFSYSEHHLSLTPSSFL